MGTWHNFKLSRQYTHKDLYAPVLRMMLARDLWVLRKVRRVAEPGQWMRMDTDYLSGIRIGLETAFRRIQDDGASIPELAGRDQFVVERKYFPSREERLEKLKAEL